MFSCNRDFHSACWGEFAQTSNSTLFNGIDGTGVASNIKTQMQFNTPSCMSKLLCVTQTWTLSSQLWQNDENEKNASIYSLSTTSTTNQSLLEAEGVELLPKGPMQRCQECHSKLQVTAKCLQQRSCSNKDMSKQKTGAKMIGLT